LDDDMALEAELLRRYWTDLEPAVSRQPPDGWWRDVLAWFIAQ
jgi:hypothetical protein